MLRFAVGDYVLCCMGHRNWMTGIVDGLNVEVNGAKGVYGVNVGGGNLVVVQEDDDRVRALTAENAMSVELPEDELEWIVGPELQGDPRAAQNLLEIAVTHRRPRAAAWIGKRARVPVRMLGARLLKLAVESTRQPTYCYGFAVQSQSLKDAGVVHGAEPYEDLRELLRWLEDPEVAGIGLQEYDTGSAGRHPEHVAATYGDEVSRRTVPRLSPAPPGRRCYSAYCSRSTGFSCAA